MTSAPAAVSRPPRRKGRLSRVVTDDLLRCNIYLQRRLVDWAKEQPEGLSTLLRRILREEYNRKHQPGDL